jgi:hypothetical protein
MKDIQVEIDVLENNLMMIYRNRTRLTSEDYEDVSDAYQARLEENWEIRDINEQLDQLQEELFLMRLEGYTYPDSSVLL